LFFTAVIFAQPVSVTAANRRHAANFTAFVFMCFAPRLLFAGARFRMFFRDTAGFRGKLQLAAPSLCLRVFAVIMLLQQH